MVSTYFEGDGNMFPARSMDAYKASFFSEWLSVVSFTHWPLFHREITFWYPLTMSLLDVWTYWRERSLPHARNRSPDSPGHGLLIVTVLAIFENITFRRQAWQDMFGGLDRHLFVLGAKEHRRDFPLCLMFPFPRSYFLSVKELRCSCPKLDISYK